MSDGVGSGGRLLLSMCAVAALAVPAAAQIDQPRAHMYFDEAAAIGERQAVCS